MAKKSNNTIKILIGLFLAFFIAIAGYEYFLYGSIFNNSEHYRKIYKEALQLKNDAEYDQAASTLQNISPRYEAYDAVLYQLAQCYTKQGNEQQVQKNLKSLISKYPQSYLYVPAKYDLAKSYLRSNNVSAASDMFQNIINAHKGTAYETGSYYYLAELSAKKSPENSLKYMKQYISQSQDGRFSLDCANNIIKAKEKLSPNDNYYLGLVFYNAQKYDKALQYFNATDFSKAWFYIAKINIQKGNYQQAKDIIKQGLQKHISNYDQEQLADIMQAYANISSSAIQAWDELSDIALSKENIEDIALYNKAKYLPEDRAIILYKKIVEHHLKGDYSSEALKKLFWHEYNLKNFQSAEELALKHVSKFTNTKSAPEMHFWLGKLYEKEKNTAAALKIYNKILSKYPDDYYAMRALGRITYLTKGKDFGWNMSKNKQLADEDFVLKLPYSYAEIKTKFGATLAELLMIEDFETIEYFNDFDEPFIESWIYYRKGLRSTATTTARNAMEEITEKPAKSDLKWKIIYPCYFSDYINKYAARNKISPFLMISLIREESYFNPLALSGYNAVGLTQILPTTAKEVSARRGYGKINEFLLFNPEINIKYGTAYFTQIKKQVKNNNVYAVAAYNGGAGAVSSWLRKYNTADTDEFIEHIPYPETQNYVKKVYRSYWNYSRIYANSL